MNLIYIISYTFNVRCFPFCIQIVNKHTPTYSTASGPQSY